MSNRGFAADQLFTGRERIVREIVEGVLAEQPASFSIVGSKLVGKSRLLQYLASDDGPLLSDDFADWRPYPFQDSSRIVVVRIDCGLPAARQDFMGFLCDEIGDVLRREAGLAPDIDPAASHAVRLMATMRQLDQLGYRPILLLDNFDRVFADLPHDTVNELRPLTLQAALVVATEQPLHDLDRSLASSPLFNVMTQLFVGLLEDEAARRWLEESIEPYPALRPCLDELLEMTGTHPYLLRKMDDILAEVRRMLPAEAQVVPDHLPLIRLRLAEHGRMLFEMVWRRLQNPPPRVSGPVAKDLLQRMFQGPISIAKLTREETAAVNWIINQAMITCARDDDPARVGYDYFSPLLRDYLAGRVQTFQSAAPGEREAAASRPTAAHDSAHEGVQEGAQGAPSNGTAAEGTVDPAFAGSLTKTEASLLRYFQHHSRQTIPPEQLLRDVWKRPDATARRVQEAIRRLRLELETADPPIGTIENDRGRGYRFVPA